MVHFGVSHCPEARHMIFVLSGWYPVSHSTVAVDANVVVPSGVILPKSTVGTEPQSLIKQYII